MAVLWFATDCVLTVKFTLDWFAGTVTVAGTIAMLELLDNAITSPPGPAAPFKVRVPVVGFPPTTGFGLNVSAAGEAGDTDNVALWLTPLRVAWMTEEA